MSVVNYASYAVYSVSFGETPLSVSLQFENKDIGLHCGLGSLDEGRHEIALSLCYIHPIIILCFIVGNTSLQNMITLPSVASKTDFHDYIHNIYNANMMIRTPFG